MMLPKTWDDLTYSQWRELDKILSEKWISEMERDCEVVAFFLDTSVDSEDFTKITFKEMREILNQVKWCFQPALKTFPDKVFVCGIEWHFINLDEMSIGEWIDLDYYIQNIQDNITTLASFLWRKKKGEGLEKYNYKPDSRKKIFEELKPSELLGNIERAVKWRNNILKNYSSIFEEQGWDQIEGEEQLPVEEVVKIKEEIAREKKLAKFSWLRICWDLCDKDITKMDKVFKTPFILVFNILAMKKSLKI